MAKVFSLSTVTVVIANDTKGTITIGGAGKLVGSISYAFNEDNFSMESTPDGGAVASFNGSKAGSIALTVKQTSSHIAELTDFITWCKSNPQSAASKITISDPLGNIACTANYVFPVKQPDNSVGATASDRTFNFIAGEIVPNERSV
jgi:hypothetical protein